MCLQHSISASGEPPSFLLFSSVEETQIAREQIEGLKKQNNENAQMKKQLLLKLTNELNLPFFLYILFLKKSNYPSFLRHLFLKISRQKVTRFCPRD